MANYSKEELQYIASQVQPHLLELIKSNGLDVDAIEVVEDTEGITSLPAYDNRGGTRKVVRVPLSVFSKPATDAAAELEEYIAKANAATESANTAAENANAALGDINGLKDEIEQAVADAQQAVTDASSALEQTEAKLAEVEQSEQERAEAEQARADAEESRAVEYATLKDGMLTAIAQAEAATDNANDTADHPTYIGEDHYVYKWNKTAKAYDKTDIYVKGEAFSIRRVWKSVAEKDADKTKYKEGDFGLINTNDVENPDNAQLYVYHDGAWEFLVDMSGAIGFTGKTPQLSIGSVSGGAEASVTLSEDGVDADGNPKYKLNLVLPKGEQGDQGFTPVFEMGTTVTLEPGSQATATLTPNGVDTEGNPKYLLNLSIPRGQKGENGDGSGNVLVSTEGLTSGKTYLFSPSQDGSAEGEFVEYEVPEASYVPDEEDITAVPSGNVNVLKLKNRDTSSGMGYVILRKDKTAIEQMTEANTIYEIRYDFDLDGETLEVPEGCVLDFKGGSFSNGTIVGDNTKITNCSNYVIFSLSIEILGVWDIDVIYDSWFEFDNAEKKVSNSIIANIFQLTNDNVNNVVIFNSPRIYWYELPYKGPANLGDLVDRDYGKLSSDEYSYLRIFTNVASNTEVVIDNELRMIPTNQGFYRVFYIKGKHNITFRGKGGVYGDAHEHLYTDPFAGEYYFGEFGHVFTFLNCHNITVKELTVSDAFGDNLYVGCAINEDKTEGFISSDIVIGNCNINYARRNGLTANAHNMFISHCCFKGNGSDEIRGTDPKSAIDLESDYISIDSNLGNKNIQITDCSFLNNKYDFSSTNSQTSGFEGISAFISNCNFTSLLRLNKTAALTFVNCHIVAISSHDNSISAWSGSNNLSFVSCSFDELNPYLVVSAKTGGKNFINCSYPEDIEYSTSYYMNMVPGRVAQFKIPRPLYGELEFTAIASLPAQCPSNTTKYRIGENVQCDILSTKITSRNDSTNRFSSYSSVPVFSYIDTTDGNYYYIYFTLGAELIGATASNNWNAVVYLKSKTKYVLVSKGETDSSSDPISGNVYGKLSDITRTYIDKTEIPSSVVFPKEEIYDVCEVGHLPEKLKSSQAGRCILILNGERLPAFWNSFDSEFIAADGWNVTYPRKGYTSNRPILDNSKDIGYRYFDRTINKPIWWTGSKWVDATGVEV